MPIKEFDPEAFAKRLKYLRTKVLKLTRTQICEQVGVTRPTYREYEYGRYGPKACFVYNFCAAYGISADWLLGLKEGNPWVR